MSALKGKLLPALSLATLVLIVYWPLGGHDFINYDDDVYVTANPQVRGGLTIKGIQWAFTTNRAANWHPLTWISHMADATFYRLDPAGHHLTSLFLHLGSVLILFVFLEKATGSLYKSALAAALFALHPLNVETVAWVAERKGALSSFFWMLTMAAYLYYVQRPGVGRYLLLSVFFVAGLMAKQMLVTLPFVLLLLDYWPLGRFGVVGVEGRGWQGRQVAGKKMSPLGLAAEKIPLFAITGVFSIIAYLAQNRGGAVTSVSTLPFHYRLNTALTSYTDYISKMVIPKGLAVYYPYNFFPSLALVAVSALVLISISVLAVIYAKRAPWFFVGWFWYAGTLFPVSQIIQVGLHAKADRYVYIPLIGLFIVLVWGVGRLVPESFVQSARGKAILGACAVTVVVLLAITCRIQLGHWKNTLTIFKHDIEVTEHNFNAYFNIGSFLLSTGKYADSLMFFTVALNIMPNSAPAYNNQAIALAALGRNEEALTSYTAAIGLKPSYPDPYSGLGNLLKKMGHVEDAVKLYHRALEIGPDNFLAHNNLGVALQELGRPDEAVQEFRKSLKINPFFIQARENLSQALEASGRKPPFEQKQE